MFVGGDGEVATPAEGVFFGSLSSSSVAGAPLFDPLDALEVTVAPVIASTPPPTSASPEVPTNCTRKSMSVNAFRPRPKVSSMSRTTRPVTWPLLSTPVHWRMGPA